MDNFQNQVTQPQQEGGRGVSNDPPRGVSNDLSGGSVTTPLNKIKRDIKKDKAGASLASSLRAMAAPKKADAFLASPGVGKNWGPKTKTPGKVKNALSRAFVETWDELLKGIPLPAGLLGRLSKASTPFIQKELDDNLFIIRSAMNTVFLCSIFNGEFKNFSRDFSDPPGKLLTAAAVEAFTLLCEGKQWAAVREATLAAARSGSHRVDVHYTRIIASHPTARTARGGGGVLDRLAAAAATSAEAANPTPRPYWAEPVTGEPTITKGELR